MEAARSGRVPRACEHCDTMFLHAEHTTTGCVCGEWTEEKLTTGCRCIAAQCEGQRGKFSVVVQ